MATVFKRDEILILLGAGASVDAGIPHSVSMVQKLECLLQNDKEWKDFLHLYNYVKSAIIYSDGIRGHFVSGFNIERLVSTLDDLRKGDDHPLYPFIGAWSPKLTEVAGPNLARVHLFRELIVKKLREWVTLNHNEDAQYYARLTDFAKEYEHPLRVFSLNYDRCVEIACAHSAIGRGFDGDKCWDWRMFEPVEEPAIFLYKLHGSVDWEKGTDGRVTYRDGYNNIHHDQLSIIFGTTYKLQYVDPFLFLAYQFRRWTLDSARLIVAIGYGFYDDHINGIMAQALKNNPTMRVLAVIGPVNEERKAEETNRILRVLGLSDSSRVACMPLGAKEFLTHHLTIIELAKVFPSDVSPFEEIESPQETGKVL
ncbi:SIR2 family protein [Candidatus Sumerlaeota bacterium]|nr:SIR2 family protein [Candidatus Sumerlaeota bacterium]